MKRCVYTANTLCLLVTFLGGRPSPVHAQQPDLARAAATITPEDYARRVAIIAHDSMMGRDTPSPGLEKTAEWIASELQRFGLRGGGEDGTFIQRYPVEVVTVDLDASSLQVTGGARLAFGTDILPARGILSDVHASGGMVLLSGSRNPRNVTPDVVRGRHVVLVPGRGQGLGRETAAILGAAKAAGALSVIVPVTVDDARWAGQVRLAAQPSVRLPDDRPNGDPVAPTLQVRPGSLARLLQGSGFSFEALEGRSGLPVEAHLLPGATVGLDQRLRVVLTGAPNVVGILEGSDSQLRDEYVLFSAHMDHVGIGPTDSQGDSIFNGADDDASGTVAVVAVAEAMASLPTPPRRGMIFLLVSGEERGLWGSEYYAAHPSVPVEAIVANLNVDMVGRNWKDTIAVIGKEHSSLGGTVEEVARRHPELSMTAIDDIWPQENFYGRSDHYNFAVRGVPILFFFNGTHPDYHGLDDEADRIDAEKAARIAKLVFYLGVELAETAARPTWNPDSYRRIVRGGH